MTNSPDPPDAPSPEAVAQFAEQARQYVEKAIGVPLDNTSDTLPVLDHYLRSVSEEASEIVALVAAATGCYFGEVVRARFDATWRGSGSDPASWDLFLPSGDLSFSPVAVVVQAIRLGADPDFDDSFRVPTAAREILRKALDRLPPVSEDVYYSLSNRLDTLETVMDLLVAWKGRRREAAEESPPRHEDAS